MFEQFDIKLVGFEMGDPNNHPAQAWRKVKFEILTETSKFELPIWVGPDVHENKVLQAARETLRKLMTQGSDLMNKTAVLR